MGDLEIVRPGIYTTVQDSGRYGYQSCGIPVSGAMDRYSYKAANYILGNDLESAVIEATVLGPRIEFNSSMEIAITGADMSPSINGSSIEMWRSLNIKAGDCLDFGELKSGARTYIAFSGGIDIPKVMESRSTYVRGKIGGYAGRQLLEGDRLKVFGSGKEESKWISRVLDPKYIPKYRDEIELRVILGPQAEHFTPRGIETFLSSEYRCTPQIDRMGYRLSGSPIESISGTDIISDGIAFGAVQVSNSGEPIVMMADRQTVGGYAKIACIVSEDISKIAQAKTGDTIKFRKVTIEEVQFRNWV
jgi:antagonist of KipI